MATKKKNKIVYTEPTSYMNKAMLKALNEKKKEDKKTKKK